MRILIFVYLNIISLANAKKELQTIARELNLNVRSIGAVLKIYLRMLHPLFEHTARDFFHIL